jgi:hypothetical protein
MRRDCINTSNPDYIAIVQALKDAGVITAEFEAKRDYLEYGTFRNPEDVVAKVLTKMPEVIAFAKPQIQDISKLGGLTGELMQSEKGSIGVNKQQLLMLLGPTMYNKPLAQVAIKELLQNSFDAIKARMNITGNTTTGNLNITVDYNNRTISIQDDGIGMTPDIVKNAFLSIGGTNKEGLDVSERSGGFGLAKVQFLLGSEYVRVVTIRDGIKTSINATAIQLYNDDFLITTEQTTEPNGSFVEVKIPESYTTAEGVKRSIDFPGEYSSTPYERFDILDKPLIGDLNVNFTWVKGDKTNTKVLPLGKNITEEVLPPLFSKLEFSWGTADLYMSTEKKEYPSHKILSSGIYQFETSFSFRDWENIPYDIVVNIKPSVASTSEQYPFNNQREGFKNTVKNDIKALNNYLKKYASGEAEKDAKAVFSNITGLPKVDPNKVLTPEERSKLYADVEKTIEENKRRRIEKGLESAEEEVRKVIKLIISEKGVKNAETGKLEVSTEKDYDTSFKAEKEIEAVEAIVTTDFNPALPQYHNNTNVDYLNTPGAAEFFSDFGSVVLDMVRFAGNELGYEYKKLKSIDEKFFAGVSIDKQYAGIHIRKIINAIFVNPLAFDVKSLEEAVGVALHVTIHEINHTTVSGEGANFTTALGILYGKIYGTGKYALYEGLFRSVYKKHFDTFVKLKIEYDKSNTRNLSESFEGDEVKRDTSRDIQRDVDDVSTRQTAEERYRRDQEDNKKDKTGDVILSKLEQANQVVESIEEVALITNPERSNNPDVGETSVKTAEVVDNANATANLTQLAEMLMVNLGVNYELVTAERAKQMLGDKYNGEPAFYYGDTVFFVGERLTMEMVFHEFSHPLVRAIRKGNPQLFENLYDSLEANSPDIIDYVKTEYQELVEGTPAFMEEVIVTALGRMATLKSQNAPIEKGFAKVIKDILAAIKKMLRQLFGKVNVSTLDVDTSLDTLANMLVEGNRFALSQLTAETDTEAMFFKNTEQEVEELTRLVDRRTKNSTAQQAANIVYERTRRHIQELRFNKDYKEIAKLFRDQFGEAQYSIITKNLSKYQNLLEDKLEEIENDVTQAKNRADAVINTLVQIEIMAEKLDNYFNTDFDSVDNKDTLAKIMNYNKIIMSWENMITELKEVMRNAEYTVDGVTKRLSDKNATYDLVIRIGEKVGRIKERVNEIVTETTSETYEEILGPIQEAIDEKYKRLIDLAKSTNQPAWLIKSYEDEYANITLKDANGQIKDKIKKLLGGELNDANFLNSYLEGYMYNQDPTVFGLAKYIKDNYIDALNNAQRYYNEFATEMLPILEKLGFNPNNIRELGNILTFLDDDGFVDEKGVFQKRKVHTFLNANKNWRHDLKEWENKLEEEKLKAKSRGDYSTYRKMEAEFEKWQRKYFYEPFAREIYDLNKLFQDSIGQEAKRLKDEALNNINSLSQKVDDPNDFVEMKTIEDAWDQYNQLFSLTYPDGTDKKGADLKIAERLIEYRTKSRQYYKYVDRPGAFQAAFSSFLEKLTYELNSGKITKEQFDIKKEQWLRANSVVKIKEEFYAEKNRILNAIKILTDKINIPSDVDKEISDLYRRRANIISGNRDDNRQLNLDSLSPEALEELNQIEDQLEKLKDEKLTSNGLTKAEARDYYDLNQMSSALLTDEEIERLEMYEQKMQDFKDSGQAKNGLTDEEKLALESLFKELEDLETIKPSNYYLNQFAAQLKNIQDDPSQPFQLRTILYEIFTNDLGETITDVDKLYEKGLLDAFEKAIITPRYESEGKQLSFIQLPGNENLRAWFNKTHRVARKYDKKSKGYKKQVVRRNAYSYTEPTDNKYKESTVILDENGVEQTIYRVPSLKFKKRVENEAYANTERTVYKTIDNRGQWLPKNKEDMIAYRQAYPEEFDPSDPNEHLRYINEKYYELKEDPSKRNYFEALQKLTDFYLKYQEGLSLNAKLYLDVPRYRMGSLETFQLNGTRKTVKNIWESIKNIFTATKDGYLNGQNFEDEVVMTNMDMFDENDTRVPIDGKNYIDHEIVSLNVINSVMRYMLSGEKHKVKLKMLPFAKGIQEAVKDPNTNAPKKNKDMSRFYKSAFKNLGRMVFLNKKGENLRAKVIDNLFEREFEGVLQAGPTAEWQGLNKFSDFLFRRASMGFFALNVPSALKNNFGAQYQAFLEGVGGKYYNTKDLAKGNAWASKTMLQLSMNIYNRGPHSLELQKVEIFDPSQGRYESKMDERITRTLLKDVMNYQGVLLNTRKWLELQSALSVYGAMMYGQMIEITENGVKKMIPYMDAWVLDDKNQIKLRDGIDKEWGIGGTKYKTFINRMHDVQNKVAGGNSAFENPDAQRYLLYRFVAFLKRFITRILMSRFQFRGNVWDPMPRYNVAATDTDMGWYLEGMRNIYRLIRTQGQYRHMMDTREKLLTFRMFVEMFTLYGMIALLPFLFGYDPDDEDRYRKLREKSGPMPFLFAPEDDRYEFNLKGWLENHALLMMIQVRSENELFNPILGRRELLNMAKLESIAIGATVEKWSDAITDLYRLATGDERAFYKRDVGPYEWQKEGSPKVLKDILSTYGFTGSTLSPEEYLKTITSIRNR